MKCQGFAVVLSILLVAETNALQKSNRLSVAIEKFHAAHPGVLRVGGEVKAPRLINEVRIRFPEDVRRKKRRSLSPIVVEAVISKTGNVLDPTIVMSEHPDLDLIVLSTIRQWRYEPARRKGKPVAVFLTVTVTLEPRLA